MASRLPTHLRPLLQASVQSSRQQWLGFLQKNASTLAVPTSTAPESQSNDFRKEAHLPNHDPASDSQSAALLHDLSPYMVRTYVRPPPIMVKGEGCYIWDIENRRFLDFTAGIAVNSLGHCDPEVAKLLFQQARTLIHSSNLYHNPWTGALSKLLISRTRELGGMHNASRAFISNSGSEANEAALKFCRKVGKQRAQASHSAQKDKHEFVSFHSSFHGRTMGSLSATPNPKYQAPFSPLIPGFKYGNINCSPSELEQLITLSTCGVIIEPIQGEGGINMSTPEFLHALRQQCNKVGAVLVFDEIQCGLSRTGSFWAHSTLPPEDHPDVITTAKALGNGFPIGATLVSEEVADAVATGDHGTTFGGNPLACRVAHHVLERLTDPDLMASVKTKEEIFRQGFARLQERFPDMIAQGGEGVRGRGLILGLQMTREPTPVVTAARERGLLIITCGTNTLRFVPPLVISQAEIEEGLAILEQALAAVRSQQIPGTKGQQEMAPAGR